MRFTSNEFVLNGNLDDVLEALEGFPMFCAIFDAEEYRGVDSDRELWTKLLETDMLMAKEVMASHPITTLQITIYQWNGALCTF